MASFLDNRYQIVSLGNINSKCLKVHHGVPQGSVLGPLLFLIYINDFPAFMQSQILLFADDTTLINTGSTVDATIDQWKMTQSKACRWFNANCLTLNQDKTVNMSFSLKKSICDEFNKSVKFLGLHIDSTLQWKDHEELIAKKISKGIFLLRNLSCRVPAGTLRTAYFALCHTHISYGLLVWGHSCIRNRIFKMQRKAIRVIAGL